jgi:dTDP-4-amino-4,6-dideoxygalactose transaminase
MLGAAMRIPQLDLKLLHEPILDELRAAADEVIRSGRYIGGPAVEGLEKDLAELIGASHAVAVSNGTDALVAALQALGVGAGDEVLTSPMSFFATAAAVVRLGAKPVFVDIDPLTFGIRPEKVYDYVDDGMIAGRKWSTFESEHTKVRAILPVHLFGQCVDMDPIRELADQFSLMVVEDAAQAILSRYKDQPAGTLGDAGCFSFYPSKNLGALGEGGAVTTEDEGVAEQIKMIRNHGQSAANEHPIVSGNYRMPALSAALLRVKVKYAGEWTQQRAEAAATYNTMFEEQELRDDVILPQIAKDRTTNWHQYVIRVDERDELVQYLRAEGVEVQVYYPKPIHLQDSMKHLGYQPGDLPEAERAAKEVLSLPLFPGITYEQQEAVVLLIKKFFDNHR